MTTTESNVQCGRDFQGILRARKEHSETVTLRYEHGEKCQTRGPALKLVSCGLSPQLVDNLLSVLLCDLPLSKFPLKKTPFTLVKGLPYLPLLY